ncbi:MAG: hypothetical protein XE11_2028 [Methanomicrobiales archaeon 53_19]|nr:MAG: hypothetical protein XE11_2028 [Methanomicrobiales archaeon 53_19]
MNSVTTARDLLYPLEWAFRLFIAAMLIQVVSPYRTYAFPDLANSFIFPLSYYLFVIAAAGTVVVQVWVAMKFISSRRQNVPQHQ